MWNFFPSILEVDLCGAIAKTGIILVHKRLYLLLEAQQVMDSILQANLPSCPAEKFLQTLFQIRDADLVSWWNWLDGELATESSKEDR